MWLTNLKVVAITIAVLLFYTAVAHLIPQLESEVPEDLNLSGDEITPAALVAAGERVFNGAGGCTACHGLGTRAPNLRTDRAGQGAVGARCVSRFGDDCKTYLYTTLTEPGDSVVPGFENIMPDLRRQLPEDQIWATVAYLQSLGGEVTVSAADLPSAPGAESEPVAAAPQRSATMDPRQLLQESTCLACHQLDGAGPAIGPSFDGVGGRLSPEEIRRAILEPAAEVSPGFEAFASVMPATFGDQLSAAQLEVLVQFLVERR
jgi:mono/diheme cytochrome c family protein